MSENVEEPPEKRTPLTKLENENLTKYNTAYSVFVCEG